MFTESESGSCGPPPFFWVGGGCGGVNVCRNVAKEQHKPTRICNCFALPSDTQAAPSCLWTV